MSDNESLSDSVIPEVKATTILSIRDTLRQRGLTLKVAADLAGVTVGVLRDILSDPFAQRAVEIETLDRVLEAINNPRPPEGKP